MPDRDPALGAAFEAWMRALTPDGPDDEPMSMTRESFYGGYDAALRSLGAGTPEAQAALRELVAASLEEEQARQERVRVVDDEGLEQYAADSALANAFIRRRAAAERFAALATPPEEGR